MAAFDAIVRGRSKRPQAISHNSPRSLCPKPMEAIVHGNTLRKV